MLQHFERFHGQCEAIRQLLSPFRIADQFFVLGVRQIADLDENGRYVRSLQHLKPRETVRIIDEIHLPLQLADDFSAKLSEKVWVSRRVRSRRISVTSGCSSGNAPPRLSDLFSRSAMARATESDALSEIV